MSLLTIALHLLLTGSNGPITPAVPFLPTLSSFTAAGSGQHVSLAWTLAPSAKVAYVIVQRQTTAPASWEAIANRPVTATSRYQLQDNDLRAGTYRLVTIDYDGTPAFSRPLTVR